MKKILAGMLYRLFKGFEIWALLALFIVISGYFTFVEISTLHYVAVKHDLTNTIYFELEDTVITKDNADQFCYKGSGIKAYDLYRYGIEKIPQDSLEDCSVTELLRTWFPAGSVRAGSILHHSY